MDLISVESSAEQDFIGREMKRAGVREIWTSGRLCDKEVTMTLLNQLNILNIRTVIEAAY